MKKNKIKPKEAKNNEKTIIKESRRLINSQQKTEIYIQYYPRSNSNKSKKAILIAGNSIKDCSIKCKLSISSFENHFDFTIKIEDYLAKSLSIHLKIYLHEEDNTDTKLLENILMFDKKNKEKTVYATINTVNRNVFFLYMTLSNSHRETENESKKLIGIIDEGYTSYMDSIIQSLFWLGYIRKYVYQIKPTKESFAYQLQELFYNLQANDRNPVRIDKVLNCLTKKSDWNQLKDPINEFFTVINNIDKKGLGYLFNITTKKNTKDKRAQYLSIDLDHNSNTIEEYIASLAKENGKHFFIELPKVLLIHLNRFDQGNSSKKNCSYCKYEQKLFLSSFTTDVPFKKANYQLFSVIVHEGQSMAKGAFYSYIKLLDQNDYWWKLKGTIAKQASNDEVFKQNYGGQYDSFSFPTKTNENIISIQKDDEKTAYILIYINEYFIKELFPDDIDQELSSNVIARCQKQKDKEKENQLQSQLLIKEPTKENKRNKQTKKLQFYTQMRSSIPGEISFFNDVNQIFINNIINNQETFVDPLNTQSLLQNNNHANNSNFFNNNNNNNNNTSILSVIQPFNNNNNNNHTQANFDNINESLADVRIFNESFFYLNPNTSKRYLKLPFSINLIHNETNRVLQKIDFEDTPLDTSTTSKMFLPICYKKLPSHEYYDISLFKFVLLTNKGLYIKILNDLDDICSYIQLHHHKKVILCLYTIEMEILMQLNETKKLISINYIDDGYDTNTNTTQKELNTLNNELNYPLLISNSKLYACSKPKCLRAIRQLVEKYSNREETTGIYTVKRFGNTITEAIEKKTIDMEEIDESCYDMIQHMKIVRLIVK